MKVDGVSELSFVITKVIIAAQTKDLPFVIDVMIADAYALHEGLYLPQHLRCNLIVLHAIYEPTCKIFAFAS
jgi:hypothetical protein